MIKRYFGQTLLSVLFLISNTLSHVAIKKMTVPELVQKDNASDVIIDCDYTVTGDEFSLRWLFNNEDPVYEWHPPSEPRVRGVLEGRLDLQYRISEEASKERRALRILQPDETLSGAYTCVVQSGPDTARETRDMLVFSIPRELSLMWQHVCLDGITDQLEVVCAAQGVYPQPNLMLKRDHLPINRVQQRVWRSGDGSLFDARTLSIFKHRELRNMERFTCRLELPDAGYVAISEKIFVFRNSSHNFLAVNKLSAKGEFTEATNHANKLAPSTVTAYILLCSYKYTTHTPHM